MTFTVRRLVAEDHEALRTIRLRALSMEPHAFGSTFQRESAFGEDLWRQRLHPEGNPHFGCFDESGGLVGLVAAMIDEADKSVAELVGMWVDPEARGTGSGDALIGAVCRWAVAKGCTSTRLHVTDGNDRAEGMYRRNGFAPTGHTILRERDHHPEIEMERPLTAERP
jgi:GNAT superfamily N-acetyltransferase